MVLHEREPDSDSSDDLRTLVRASVPELVAGLGGYVPPPSSPLSTPLSPLFARPPAAPTFGAPPSPGEPLPFTKTEKSISQDLIPQGRGQRPAPVGIVAAPPLPLPPGLAAAPLAPFAPPLPLAAPASWTSGSRGLLIGFAFGVTIVVLLVAGYVLFR